MSSSFQIARAVANSIDEMFLKSADEDYIVARWSAQNGLLHQFIWSSQQSLEKVLKAIILKNRIEIGQFKQGHPLTELYREFCQLDKFGDGEFELGIPNAILKKLKPWSYAATQLSTSEFLDFLECNSPASSRYRSNTQTKAAFASVHLLDAIFGGFRTIASPSYIGMKRPLSTDKIELVSYMFPQLNVATLDKKESASEALVNQNAVFFPELFDGNSPLITGFAVRNTPVAVPASNAKFFGDQQAVKDFDWLINNANLSKKDKHEVRQLRDAIHKEAYSRKP